MYLALPATSCPSERIFSIAGRIISSRRTRLDPEIAGKSLYVADNWKWWIEQIPDYKVADIQDDDEELQVVEKK